MDRATASASQKFPIKYYSTCLIIFSDKHPLSKFMDPRDRFRDQKLFHMPDHFSDQRIM
jgi:hypothetical protein